MRKCDDCRIILDDSAEFCPSCGKAISGQAASQPDGGVGALLASANLRRMRGELNAAAEDAQKAFHRDPNNAEAASLLAAIYEDQGDLEEALVWCQVAVDLDPKMPVYRARLDRIRSRIASESSAFAPVRAFLRKRWVRVVASIAAALVVVAVIVSTWGRPYSPKARPAARVSKPVTIAAPGEQQPPRRPAQSGGMPLSGAQPAGTIPAQAPQPASSARQSLRTLAEIYLRDALSASEKVAASGARIDDVIADPRQAVVTVTFSMSSSSVLNKERILSAAYAIALAAFAANNEAQFVTVRCLIPGNDGGAQIAFVGDTARQTVHPLPDQPSAGQMEAAFGRPWWHAYIK